MTVVSHFALPVIVSGLVNLRAVRRSGLPLFRRLDRASIGFCGTLPDLLTPHLSLHARYTSWSHTLVFFAALLLLGVILARVLAPRYKMVLQMCVAAVFLHLLCDMASGGVNLVPGLGRPLGDYYISARYWLWLDLASLVAAYLVCRRTRQELARMSHAAKPEEV
ncbi:MAG: metal-dependent hydrolase [bacterium]